MRLALLTAFLIAGSATAQPPAGQADASWKGEKVMPKFGRVQFEKIVKPADDGEPVVAIAFNTLVVHLVRDEQEGRVLLRMQDGTDAWIAKDSLVPLKDAVAYFTKELEGNPAAPIVAFELRAHARRLTGDLPGAIDDIDEAIRLAPMAPGFLAHRALCRVGMKDYDKAQADLDEALRMQPTNAHFLSSRATLRRKKAQFAEAAADFEEALKNDPKYLLAHNDLAWLLATCPNADFRDGPRAVKHAELAVEMTQRKNGTYLDTLAAAYAEAKRFDDAVRIQQEALGDRAYALKSGNAANERLELYRQRKAYREE